MPVVIIPISKIKLPPKPRRDMGDLEALADSIREVGLLQAPVVNSKHELIAGERRLRAYMLTGQETIAVNLATSMDDVRLALLAQRDENTQRKEPSLKEAMALADEVEAALKPIAEEAKKKGQFGKAAHGGSESEPPANLQESSTNEKTGRLLEVAASAAGIGKTKLIDARAVVEAAKDDEGLKDVVEEMERSGNVNAAKKEVKKRKRQHTTKADELKDALGVDVPRALRDHFGDIFFDNSAEFINETLKKLKKVQNGVRGKSDAFPYLRAEDILKSIRAIVGELELTRDLLLSCKPYAVCSKCNGKGCEDNTEGCLSQCGWLPKHRYVVLRDAGVLS